MSFTCKEPKLRFSEFSGEWVEKKIGELCSIFKSGEAITSENIFEKGLYPVFGGNGLRGYTNSFTHDGFYFLIGRQGALCGNINRTKEKAFISEHAIAVEANETSDTEWLAQRLDYYNLNKLSESSAQPGLAVNKVIKFKLFIPSKPEQEKIASFLTAVDAKIEQLTYKEKLLEKYKKSALQKLFSQELRFTCNDGSEYPEWEEKKLGDLDIYISDGNYGEMYPKADEIKSSGIPFIRANNIKNLKLSWQDMKYIDEDLHSTLTSGHLKTNDILVTTRGDIGMSAYVTEDFNNSNINAQICLLRCKEDLNSFYLLQFLASTDGLNQFKTLQTGSALKQLPKKSLNDIKVPIPNLEEQTKIANFLSAIDEKCLHVKTQIEQTKQFKKALLQQMFV